jgi:hypothetical protein
MFWKRRAQLADPETPPAPATEPSDPLVDEFLDTWISWREACGDVRAAYRRWIQSDAEQRELAFAGYRAALDREDQAARVHSSRTERLRAATR